ncbi:alpha/beta hydrolase [Undibacterium sp. Di26W]|uniref:alpha/beta hydrolase n=1 Tax=Undibacterium sp. Di26W TaxID=3413035 RepID=UPI003BEFDC1F
MNKLAMKQNDIPLATSSSTSAPPSRPTTAAVLQALITPRRLATSDDDRMALSAARPFSVDHAGLDLVAWRWGQETDPIVLLLHGWESRASHMASFVAPLLQAGYGIIALDGPAHGESQGELTHVVDYGKAVLALADQFGPPAAVIGHSAGSAASLYAYAHGLRVAASVQLCGPASLSRVVQRTAHLAGLNAEEAHALEQQMAMHIGAPLSDVDLQALQSGFLHPALILHDPEDREMPYEESRTLAAAWPQAQLRPVAGTGHRRILRSPAVVDAATGFIVEHGTGKLNMHFSGR